jgi:hypothetical protein
MIAVRRSATILAHGEASRAAEATLAAPMIQPGADRRELEAEVAYLRTFGDVYRTHLDGYLDALLRNVEEWERAEKISLDAARASLPALPLHPQPPPLTG